MSLATDIVQRALLQGLSLLTPQSLKTELQHFHTRYGFVPSLVVGTVDARDEWTTLLRAGLCYSAPGVVNAVAGQVGTVEMLPAKGSGLAILVKRVVVASPVAGFVALYANPNGAINGAGSGPLGQNKLWSKTQSVANFPGVVFKNTASLAGSAGAIKFAEQPIEVLKPLVFEDPGSFLCELQDNGGDPALQTQAGLFITATTVNADLRFSIEFAAVPLSSF